MSVRVSQSALLSAHAQWCAETFKTTCEEIEWMILIHSYVIVVVAMRMELPVIIMICSIENFFHPFSSCMMLWSQKMPRRPCFEKGKRNSVSFLKVLFRSLTFEEEFHNNGERIMKIVLDCCDVRNFLICMIWSNNCLLITILFEKS